MRPASLYYVTQAWPSQRRESQPGAPSRARRRGRHAMAPRRYNPARELPALGRGGRIRRLPPPLSAWTAARDAPAPPARTFREWWRLEHGDRDARE